MVILKISIGFLLLFLAWTYLFHNKLIFRVNAWMRDNVFSDNVALFSGRRVAVLLVILGALALFSGLEGIINIQQVQPHIAAQILEQAKKDFANNKFRNVISRCRELIRTNPDSIEAWELMVQAHSRMGEKELARQDATVLLRLDPNHPLGKSIFAKERRQIEREKE